MFDLGEEREESRGKGKLRDTTVNIHVECESHSHFRNAKKSEDVHLGIKEIFKHSTGRYLLFLHGHLNVPNKKKNISVSFQDSLSLAFSGRKHSYKLRGSNMFIQVILGLEQCYVAK